MKNCVHRNSVHRLLFRTLAFVLVGLVTCAVSGQPATRSGVPKNAVPGELIIKFKAGATDGEIEHGLKLGRLKAKRNLQTEQMQVRGDVGWTLVETDDAVEAVMERLSKHPAIEYLEPNFRYTHQAVSNDPYVGAGYTWGLYGDVGSPSNVYGSQATEAWSAGYTGSSGVYVGVIDEGIDITHPELAANIWTNPFDPVDGVDNDGNGYVDDVHGWDFAGNTNRVFDPSGDEHGTHVAGTIGAKGGNGSGVAGVNWNVTMIAGKFLGPDGGTTLEAVEAIDYLVALKKRHGINLVAINASWGGGGYSRALHEAVIRAAKEGILFIAAAGNEGVSNDQYSNYPSNLDTRVGTTGETAASYDSVIAVAAIEKTGALASFSNYGATQVDIGAPGVEILSTLPNGQLAYMSGTSMATPHVAGAVALYASTHPGISAQSIRRALLSAGLPTGSLSGKTVTGGRLDLSTVILPLLAAPTGVSANAGDAVVNLSWTPVSGASGYVVKRAQQSGGVYTTIASGVSSASYSDTAVVNGTTYYYVIAALNGAGEGTSSAAVSATPKAPVVAVSNLLGDDDTTSGSWRGVYGQEGAFAYPGGTFSPPSYVKLGGYRNFPLTWTTSTSDPRALQKTSGTDRFATAWNSPDSLYFFLNLTDGAAHEVSFYFLDYDRQGRDQLLEFFDHSSGKLLGSERISGFSEGRYSSWVLQGNVRLKITRIAGPNCVLSAMFFDPVASSGPFLKADTITSGTWKGVYSSEGGLGYPSGNFVLPGYVKVSAYKNYGLLWAASTTDPRVLQKPASTTDRVAGAWHSADEFYFNLQFSDTAQHQVSFYFLDYDRAGREQQVEIFNRSTGELLDARTLSNFGEGVYLTYWLSGNIRLRVSRVAGPNCAMSAIMFDPVAP